MRKENLYYPHLFSPMQVGKLKFKNRIFCAPTQMSFLLDKLHYPTDYNIGYFEEKARGGAALVTVGDSQIDDMWSIGHPCYHTLNDEGVQPWLSEIATAIHQHGAYASCELVHAGTGSNPLFRPGHEEPYGPSPMDWGTYKSHEMDEDMIEQTIEDYANAALRLKVCGFDMCIVHGAHGALPGQFFSPLFNQRKDRWGGSLENRARFTLEVIDRIHQKCGKDFIVEQRISGDEFTEGGTTLEDAVELARLLEGHADIIHVSAGTGKHLNILTRTIAHPDMFRPHGCNVFLAAEIKKHVSTPITTVGAINEPELAEEIIASGKADFVALARQLIADPYFPNKARLGRRDEIRPCTRCTNCLALQGTTKHFSCVINPRTGHEHRLKGSFPETVPSRNVVIVGGGPAGMNAAIWAAERGHRVTLLERSGQLGGQLTHTDFDTLKADLKHYKDYLVHMVQKRAVNVLLNTEATPELIEQLAPDQIIQATGAVPIVPPIPGIDSPNVCTAQDAFPLADRLGETIVVIGGGQVGCETAAFLGKEKGKNVTIVEMGPQLAKDANTTHIVPLMQLLKQYTSFLVNTTCTAVTDAGVMIREADGTTRLLPADSVVLAAGMRSYDPLSDDIRYLAPEYRAIGDCHQVGNLKGATHGAYGCVMDIQ